MKLFAIIALALLLICTVQARNCPSICPANFAPVCASNGSCYQIYGNQCTLDVANCNGAGFREVPLAQCDSGPKC